MLVISSVLQDRQLGEKDRGTLMFCLAALILRRAGLERENARIPLTGAGSFYLRSFPIMCRGVLRDGASGGKLLSREEHGGNCCQVDPWDFLKKYLCFMFF